MDHTQEPGEMHWTSGWMFKRLPSGSVRIRRDNLVATIPAEEWISLVHHVAKDQSAESFQTLRKLHGISSKAT